jgi:hypothetical protein
MPRPQVAAAGRRRWIDQRSISDHDDLRQLHHQVAFERDIAQRCRPAELHDDVPELDRPIANLPYQDHVAPRRQYGQVEVAASVAER